jgi:hypothetical protein
MTYKPELGQLCFGNPTGEFECPEFVEALIEFILRELERVYWNKHQKEFNVYEPLKMCKVEYRPYYWGDNKRLKTKPNLNFKGIEIRWYKHVGRGMTINKKLTEKQWVDWLNQALKEIRKKDPAWWKK